MKFTESITVEQLHRFGWEARKRLHARGPQYDDWEVLIRSLAFVQWRLQNGITDEMVEEVRKGWDGAAEPEKPAT